MVTFNQQIEDAIRVVQGRQAVFTATDVAEYAGLDDAEIRIAPVLQKRCGDGELLNLDGRHSLNRRYMRKVAAEKWWVGQTLRWAKLDMNYLTPEQLAGAMSLAFGEPRWTQPPQNLLAVGRQWAMVDDGCVPGTYVSPWASVLRANPQFAERFRIIFDFGASPYRRAVSTEESFLLESWQRIWANTSDVQQAEFFINLATDEALAQLKGNQAEVVRRRKGIGSVNRETLEQIAGDFGVTRERIRQIESKALKRLSEKSHFLSLLFCGFVAYFVRSGGPLLFSNSQATPQWKILSSAISLKTVAIPELDFRAIGFETELTDYRNSLVTPDASGCILERRERVAEELRFLSLNDAAKLLGAEQRYIETQNEIRSAEATKTRPRMVYQALRSLGRPAHYSEVAEECNRMFPDRQNTEHSWHAALMLPEAIQLGVVWIGWRGTYGLKEHGHEWKRPNWEEDNDGYDFGAAFDAHFQDC